MVFAGQFHRELAVAEALRGPGRRGRVGAAGGRHRPSGGPMGSGGPGQVARAPEPAGAGGVPAGHGPGPEPARVSARPPVPASLVPAAGRRAAASDPGPGGPLGRRRAPGHRAPAGGRLRPVPAAASGPCRPIPRPPGVRGELQADRHPASGRARSRPHGPDRFREPADGAPLRPACGAGGGRRSAPGSALVRRGAGGHRGGPGHGGGGPGAGARARVRGSIAPAAGGFSGAAPRGGAP